MKKLLSFMFALFAVMASWGQTTSDFWTDPSNTDKLAKWPVSTVFYLQVKLNGEVAPLNSDIKVRGEVYNTTTYTPETRVVVMGNNEYDEDAGIYYTELIVPGTLDEKNDKQSLYISFLYKGIEYAFNPWDFNFDGGTHGTLSNLIVANIIDFADTEHVTLQFEDMLDLEKGQNVSVEDYVKVTYGPADNRVTEKLSDLYPKPGVYVQPYSCEYFAEGRGGLQAIKSTPRSGVPSSLTYQFGEGHQYGAGQAPYEVTLSNKVYIKPFDFIADAKSIYLTMDKMTLDLDSKSVENIFQHVYLNVELCDEDAEEYGQDVITFTFSEMNYEMEQRITDVIFNVDAKYVQYNAKEGTISPVKGTTREGIDAGFAIKLDGVDYGVFGTVYVTPYDRWDKFVTMQLSDVHMDLNDDKDGYDVTKDLSFNLRANDWTAENPTFDNVAYNKLEETLGYMPNITFNVTVDNKYVAYTNGSTVLTPIKATNYSGTSLAVQASGAIQAIKSATLYIEPFDLFDEDMTMTLPAIEVNKNETIDLASVVTFHFTDPTDGTEKAMTYKAMKDAGYYVPNFIFALAMDFTPTTYGLFGEGLRGVKRTEGDPETIILRLYTADGLYSYTAPETTVTVTLNYIAAESLKLVYNSAEVEDIDMERLTTYDFKIVLEPEGAVYDLSNFSFYEDNDNVSGKDRNYFSCRFVEKSDGPYVQVTPKHAENGLSFSVNFNDGEVSCGCAVATDVKSDMNIQPGWGWYSLYNLQANQKEGMSIKNVDTQLFGGKMLDARARTQAAYKDDVYGLFGSLKRLDHANAYQIKTTATEAFTTYVTPSNDYPWHNAWTNDVLVTIMPGWNWLVYPYEFDLPVDIITQGGTNGDRLISKNDGFVSCNNANDWVGTLTTLKHGESYLYYNAGDVFTFTYTKECFLYIPALDETIHVTPSNRRAAKREAASQWHYDHHAYASNMTIIGEIANVPNASDLTIGAFVGDECRGEGKIVEADGHQYLFITVHGEGNEEVNFCLGNGVTEYPLCETLTFAPSAGTLEAPVRFVAPLSVPTAIPMTTINAATSEAIYDLQGRRVTATPRGVTIQNGKAIIR